MEIKTTEPTAPMLYPNIPEDVSRYRYSKILTLETEIKKEVLKYEKLLKQYKKVEKGIRFVQYITHGVSFCTGTAAVSTLAGGLTVFATIPLATVGGISSLVGAGLQFANNKISVKERKYAATFSLAKMTLMHISKLTSKLISDCNISQAEIESVLEIEKNYFQQKQTLREKYGHKQLKKAFLEGKKKGTESLRKKILRSSE